MSRWTEAWLYASSFVPGRAAGERHGSTVVVASSDQAALERDEIAGVIVVDPTALRLMLLASRRIRTPDEAFVYAQLTYFRRVTLVTSRTSPPQSLQVRA